MLELGHAPHPVSCTKLSDPGTCPTAPEGERSGDLAQHLSSLLYLEMEIYDSLWKNQRFKQICHGLQCPPWGCLWFLTHSWLLVSKTEYWKHFHWLIDWLIDCSLKVFRLEGLLTGLPNAEYYEKIYPYKDSVCPSYIPQFWPTQTIGMFAPFFQHGPQHTSWNYLVISIVPCHCKSLRCCLHVKLFYFLRITNDCSTSLEVGFACFYWLIKCARPWNCLVKLFLHLEDDALPF